MAWLVCALVLGLVGAYMARPHFRKREMSSAGFFKQLPPPRLSKARLSLSWPRLTRAFFLQLMVFLCILAALLLRFQNPWAAQKPQLRLWILVDVSSSMKTGPVGASRMELAIKEIQSLRAYLNGKPFPGAQFKLSIFDMEIRDLLETSDILAIEQRAAGFRAGSLGTNLKLIRDASDDPFKPSHLVVVSDMPPPDWLGGASPAITWRQVGEPLSNTGVYSMNPLRDPFTAAVQKVTVEVVSHGPVNGARRFQATGPDGQMVLNQPLSQELSQQFVVPIELSGQYIFALTGEDFYEPDNRAVIQVTAGNAIAVDWQLSDKTMLAALGWESCSENCDLRVAPNLDQAMDDTPTLVFYKGASVFSPTEIKHFVEDSPLLADVNLDAVESAALPRRNLPDPWRAALGFMDDKIWLASRDSPPAVFIGGESLGSDSLEGRLSTTAFFNGLRWLLSVSEPEPLYELTSPMFPEPKGNRLALHEGEGESWRTLFPPGDWSDFKPMSGTGGSRPIWPLFVGLALIFLLIERILKIFGGRSWQ